MNDRPVVLIYQHFFPDFSAGGPVTSIGNLATALKGKANVKVIASNRVFGTGEVMSGVIADSWTSWNGVSVWYASDRASVRAAITQLPGNAVLYLNGLFLIDYFLVPLRIASRRKLEVIIAPRGMLQQGALKAGTLKKKFFLRALTSIWLTGRERWHATDEEERRDVERWIPRRNGVTVIPNLPRPPLKELVTITKRRGELKLIYYSLISRKKNLLFLIELLQSPELSNVTLDIVGPVKDISYAEQCQNAIARLGDPGKVRWLGEQDPSTVKELILQYHCFVLPTEGENFGHAIVEALGCGRPIIISTRTPWKDVAKAGAGSALELNAALWTRTISELLQWDQSAFDKACVAALNYFAAKIHVDDLVNEYFKMFHHDHTRP